MKISRLAVSEVLSDLERYGSSTAVFFRHLLLYQPTIVIHEFSSVDQPSSPSSIPSGASLF